jgi:hypothetical protein
MNSLSCIAALKKHLPMRPKPLIPNFDIIVLVH